MPEPSVAIHGSWDSRFGVRDAFEEGFLGRDEIGASVAVAWRGDWWSTCGPATRIRRARGRGSATRS